MDEIYAQIILATPLGIKKIRYNNEKGTYNNQTFAMDSSSKKRVLVFDEAHYQAYMCDKRASEEACELAKDRKTGSNQFLNEQGPSLTEIEKKDRIPLRQLRAMPFKVGSFKRM